MPLPLPLLLLRSSWLSDFESSLGDPGVVSFFALAFTPKSRSSLRGRAQSCWFRLASLFELEVDFGNPRSVALDFAFCPPPSGPMPVHSPRHLSRPSTLGLEKPPTARQTPLPPRDKALWNNSAFDMVQLFNQKKRKPHCGRNVRSRVSSRKHPKNEHLFHSPDFHFLLIICDNLIFIVFFNIKPSNTKK